MTIDNWFKNKNISITIQISISLIRITNTITNYNSKFIKPWGKKTTIIVHIQDIAIMNNWMLNVKNIQNNIFQHNITSIQSGIGHRSDDGS